MQTDINLEAHRSPSKWGIKIILDVICDQKKSNGRRLSGWIEVSWKEMGHSVCCMSKYI